MDKCSYPFTVYMTIEMVGLASIEIKFSTDGQEIERRACKFIICKKTQRCKYIYLITFISVHFWHICKLVLHVEK